MDIVAKKTAISHVWERTPAFICIAIVLAALATSAVGIRLDSHTELDYDEGVYWQSLRAMSAGYHLYSQIFFSQPPFFLLSIFPFYDLLGSTIVSARIGVVALSLLAVPGAYLMGSALGGRAGGLLAPVLLVITPTYLAQSQILQADGPATAFLFVTIGAALMWWKHPTGQSGIIYAHLCAVTLILGILTKLLDVTAVVPIGLLILARFWQLRHEAGASFWASLLPIVTGIVAVLITTLVILAPFLESLNALVQQVVTFHLLAKAAMIDKENANVDILRHFLSSNDVLTTATIIGVIVTVMHRNWRTVPLLAWLLATLIVLIIQVPLYPHHAIVLIPPMIAIVVLAVGDLLAVRSIAWEQSAALLLGLFAFACCTIVIFIVICMHRRRVLQPREWHEWRPT